jgi:hypothetical protein
MARSRARMAEPSEPLEFTVQPFEWWFLRRISALLFERMGTQSVHVLASESLTKKIACKTTRQKAHSNTRSCYARHFFVCGSLKRIPPKSLTVINGYKQNYNLLSAYYTSRRASVVNHQFSVVFVVFVVEKWSFHQRIAGSRLRNYVHLWISMDI